MEDPRVDPIATPPDAEIIPEPADPAPEPIDDKLETVPMSELRLVRKEAAKYRTQLRDLQQKQADDAEAAKQADMTETDRLKAVAQAAEAKVISMKAHSDNVLRRSAIINAASVLNFQTPADAAGLLDISELDVDEAGNIDSQQVDELVKALAEERPYLLKSSSADRAAEFGPTSPPSKDGPRPHNLTTTIQIDKLRQESKALMDQGKVHSAMTLHNRMWELERGIKIQKQKGD